MLTVVWFEGPYDGAQVVVVAKIGAKRVHLGVYSGNSNVLDNISHISTSYYCCNMRVGVSGGMGRTLM